MPFQISLIITVLNISLFILTVSTLSYAIYDTWRHKDPLEFLLRVLAVSAGILVVGVSFFSGKSIPEIIAESIIYNKKNSYLNIIYIYIIPIILGGGAGVLLINVFNEQSVRSMRVLLFIISMIISFFYGSLSYVYQSYNTVTEKTHQSYFSEIKKCEDKLISDCGIIQEYEDIFADAGVNRIPENASAIYLLSYKLLEANINIGHPDLKNQPYAALSPNIVFLVSLILYLVVMFKNHKIGRITHV